MTGGLAAVTGTERLERGLLHHHGEPWRSVRVRLSYSVRGGELMTLAFWHDGPMTPNHRPELVRTPLQIAQQRASRSIRAWQVIRDCGCTHHSPDACATC